MFGSGLFPWTAFSSSAAACSQRDSPGAGTAFTRTAEAGGELTTTTSGMSVSTGMACGGMLGSLESGVQQSLAGLDHRQRDQPAQPAIAQAELARLAEALGGLLVALVLEGLNARQQHRLPQRLVEIPPGPGRGLDRRPPA